MTYPIIQEMLVVPLWALLRELSIQPSIYTCMEYVLYKVNIIYIIYIVYILYIYIYIYIYIYMLEQTLVIEKRQLSNFVTGTLMV